MSGASHTARTRQRTEREVAQALDLQDRLEVDRQQRQLIKRLLDQRHATLSGSVATAGHEWHYRNALKIGRETVGTDVHIGHRVERPGVGSIPLFCDLSAAEAAQYQDCGQYG